MMLFSADLAFVFDLENLKIVVNALFSDVNIFRKTLRYFAIKNEFISSYNKVKQEKVHKRMQIS
jgi:hypothetical protein